MLFYCVFLELVQVHSTFYTLNSKTINVNLGAQEFVSGGSMHVNSNNKYRK